MASFTNTLGVKAKVIYRVKGKQYNFVVNDATGPGDVGPFDEVWVEPGQTVELGDLSMFQVLTHFGDADSEAKLNKQVEDFMSKNMYTGG